MALKIVQVKVQWDGVVGATSYEIRKDGVKVATAGKAARFSQVSVDDDTKIEVVSLPNKMVQECDFKQADGTL
jgi:hypothetical protein